MACWIPGPYALAWAPGKRIKQQRMEAERVAAEAAEVARKAAAAKRRKAARAAAKAAETTEELV